MDINSAAQVFVWGSRFDPWYPPPPLLLSRLLPCTFSCRNSIGRIQICSSQYKKSEVVISTHAPVKLKIELKSALTALSRKCSKENSE